MQLDFRSLHVLLVLGVFSSLVVNVVMKDTLPYIIIIYNMYMYWDFLLHCWHIIYTIVVKRELKEELFIFISYNLKKMLRDYLSKIDIAW